jgi:D-serine deaminase-like pyridoxal phosphate-dependent protein
LPVAPSAIPRLGAVVRILGAETITLFVDHPEHVRLLESVSEDTWPGKIPVFVKIDIGYHRAGVAVGSGQLSDLAYALKSSQRTNTVGFYAHMGHSYGVGDPQEALKFFAEELEGVEQAALEFLKCTGVTSSSDPNAPKAVLSIGATPTATATQNIVDNGEEYKEYRALLERIGQSFAVELHAGVYPVMDMQQLAARARPQHSFSDPSKSMLSFADLGLRALVEVTSVYNDREQPEAMIAAGSIVMGREPCKSYPGWAVVSPWPENDGKFYDPEGEKKGWIVGRISQEHGVLSWEGPASEARKLEVGQKLLLWPNHACMCGPSFGWYLIVDSEEGDSDTIVDVWTRWRGW